MSSERTLGSGFHGFLHANGYGDVVDMFGGFQNGWSAGLQFTDLSERVQKLKTGLESGLQDSGLLGPGDAPSKPQDVDQGFFLNYCKSQLSTHQPLLYCEPHWESCFSTKKIGVTSLFLEVQTVKKYGHIFKRS